MWRLIRIIQNQLSGCNPVACYIGHAGGAWCQLGLCLDLYQPGLVWPWKHAQPGHHWDHDAWHKHHHGHCHDLIIKYKHSHLRKKNCKIYPTKLQALPFWLFSTHQWVIKCCIPIFLGQIHGPLNDQSIVLWCRSIGSIRISDNVVRFYFVLFWELSSKVSIGKLLYIFE